MKRTSAETGLLGVIFVPGALSTEATLPPLNLLRHSQMGALLSGEQRAGRRFGCLSPPGMFQDQPAQLLQTPLCQEQHPRAPSHPQDLHRSQPVGSSLTLLCLAPRRGAGRRFGSRDMDREPLPGAGSALEGKQGTLEEAAGWLCHL